MTCPGPEKCRDLECPCDGPRASWRPVVGTVFLGHGPGARFTPDGDGGGLLSWVEMVPARRGFREGTRLRSVRKARAGVGMETEEEGQP